MRVRFASSLVISLCVDRFVIRFSGLAGVVVMPGFIRRLPVTVPVPAEASRRSAAWFRKKSCWSVTVGDLVHDRPVPAGYQERSLCDLRGFR